MTFTIGSSYTRTDISAAVGGDVQSYLPHKGGRVVCVCLKTDTNPDAPTVILVGDGPGIFKCGDMLSKQTGVIPVFVKDDVNDWCHVGMYEVATSSMDQSVIDRWTLRSGRDDVRMVIFMRRVPG